MKKPHEEWLHRAQEDLRFARVGLREEFYSQVCFLAQQAVEKTLKGTLVALNRPYPKIHSLLELAKKIPELKLKPWHEKLSILDGYYVPLRYPDAAPGTASSGPPSKKEASEALATAQEIFDLAGKYLK